MRADLWFYSVVKAAVFAEQIAVNRTWSCWVDTMDSSRFFSFFLTISECLCFASLREVKLKWDSWDAPEGLGSWLLTLLFLSQQRDSFRVGQLPLALCNASLGDGMIM